MKKSDSSPALICSISNALMNGLEKRHHALSAEKIFLIRFHDYDIFDIIMINLYLRDFLLIFLIIIRWLQPQLDLDILHEELS